MTTQYSAAKCGNTAEEHSQRQDNIRNWFSCFEETRRMIFFTKHIAVYFIAPLFVRGHTLLGIFNTPLCLHYYSHNSLVIKAEGRLNIFILIHLYYLCTCLYMSTVYPSSVSFFLLIDIWGGSSLCS